MLEFIKRLFTNKNKAPKVKFSADMITNGEINSAREMLKEATALKKEKKYDEACEKLREAFSLEGAEDLMVKERMRLPMYLQLANCNDEGWRILNELNVQYTDVFSQAEIANQMRVFLQKEKEYIHAVLFSIWSVCKEVERDANNVKNSIDLADQWALSKDKSGILQERMNKKIYSKAQKGNPINDAAYKMFNDRIVHSVSKEGVAARIAPLLKKAKKEKFNDSLSEAISKYLRDSETYDLREVRGIINTVLTNDKTGV